MKRCKKLMTLILAVATILNMGAGSVLAADAGNNDNLTKEPYTYTVTFYAGNQGTFAGAAGLSTSNGAATISASADEIKVSGLSLGDTVSFNAQANVSMDATSKYYVQGVRMSGRDNDTVAASAFRVTGDADYVVAYGLKGEVTSYTVQYYDEDGNELIPSNTFYGNVGDKPVVAYEFIENYSPQALAMTKTLSENAAENVFTFVYRPQETITIIQPGEVETEVITQTVEGGTVVPGTTTEEGGETTPETAEEGEGTTTETTEEGGETTTETTEEGGEVTPGTTTEEGEGVTNEPEDLVELDDVDVPLANIDTIEEVKKGFPLVASVAIGIGSIIALILLVVFLKKRAR